LTSSFVHSACRTCMLLGQLLLVPPHARLKMEHKHSSTLATG
jgi:hypothetical protein